MTTSENNTVILKKDLIEILGHLIGDNDPIYEQLEMLFVRQNRKLFIQDSSEELAQHNMMIVGHGGQGMSMGLIQRIKDLKLEGKTLLVLDDLSSVMTIDLQKDLHFPIRTYPEIEPAFINECVKNEKVDVKSHYMNMADGSHRKYKKRRRRF